AAIALTSEAKDGVDVCTTARSKFFASATTSVSDVPCGGASISLLSLTRAAGCASQVGYQYDATSRFVWDRAPAPPSHPPNDGAWRNRVRIASTPFQQHPAADPRLGGRHQGSVASDSEILSSPADPGRPKARAINDKRENVSGDKERIVGI